MKTYYVYITTTKNNKIFYVGVTNSLHRRISEHKDKSIEGFTKKYNVNKLVYFEEASDIREAILREKELKDRRQEKKLALIRSVNPLLEEISIE